MSTTSGPVDPSSTGKSSVLPSGSLSVAFLSVIWITLGSPQARHRFLVAAVVAVAAPDDDVPQIVVGELEQRVQGLHVFILQGGDESLQDQIELEQAPAAFPVQAPALDSVHHTARLTMISLILPIARVGLSPFGQTSTQFMIVWQRNRRYGSSRLSSRSAVSWSRVSAMKRYACRRPAGPTNLSGFHQNDGHAVVQQAHRMHS